MRTMLLSLAAAAGVALATPAFAQGFYIGGPGISVGVGSGYHGYRYRSYDDFDRPRHRHWSGKPYGAYAYSRGCREITVRRQRWDGTMVVKRIHRCD
jgi:hypothetical protein